MQLRQAKRNERGFLRFDRLSKPAKIRQQNLRIQKEFPNHPERVTFYEIRKVSAYPSIVNVRKYHNSGVPRAPAGMTPVYQSYKSCRHLMPPTRHRAYPPIHVHYQPM